eukprot:CAMPEP_0172305166 /NCGR_PEP_ID=MMETSP1058-20130122/6492_1 /TAXON_ID=83371 /ORGANISM="Detonula confervacea, Strain CCMP 353" /LENGTH=100 /DNA_ID=CAMNT_0013016669 /DNA_START=54 /DNA_END=356 /DNA_ORIENTATION=+
MSDAEVEETPAQVLRMANIWVKAADGVDPEALFTKIKAIETSQPDYNLKWDDKYRIEAGKIYCTFTIALEADFDEEVMDVIEYMEGEVTGQGIIFQTAME